MAIQFNPSDFATAIEKTAASTGVTPTEDQITSIVSRIEAYLYVYPAKNDLVAAFKEAAAAEGITGDIDKMSKDFPTQLTSARNARLKAEQDTAKQAKAKADAESAKQATRTQIGSSATTVSNRLESVNGLLKDAGSKLPTIKSAAATAGISDIDDKLDDQLSIIETAARELLQCQTDVTKTSALKTAQAADKKSLQHLTDANNAMIAINGIETRVNGTAEATKAKKTKEKESAKKAKKEKVRKLDRFRSSWTGHAVIIAIFVVVMMTLFFGFLPFWFQVGAIIVFVSVLGYHAAMWFTGHERRGQNVTAIVTVLATMTIVVLLLMSLAGTGRGSDGSLLPDRGIETPTPTPQVDCWIAENIDKPECTTPDPES